MLTYEKIFNGSVKGFTVLGGASNARLGYFIQKYYSERFDQQFWHTNEGFISYRITERTLIIDEFYLDLLERKGFRVFKMADKFIEQIKLFHHIEHLIGFVNKDVHNGIFVEKLFRMYGMKEDVTHSQYQPNYLKYEKDL